MRVIANRDSYFTSSKTKEVTDIKAIFKGSVYTVINKIFDPNIIKFSDDPNDYPHGVWFYELLEQTGLHFTGMFTELPEEKDASIEIENKKQIESL